ncbi:MAG: TRAP transporter small permease [Rhodospirillales bacterium]|nr:TRAP transporter small permease [Rhodospirillales bacterium]
MGTVLSALTRAHDGLTDVSFQFSKLCLGIIVFSYCFEVVSRYFFNAPTWWADEAVSYSLSIGCFTMLPHVTRMKGHVAVTLLVELLPASRARPVYWFIYLLGFLACGFAAWISLDENIRQVVKGVQLMKVEPLPKIWISAWITYGFASSALYFLRFLDYRKIVAGGETGGQIS